MDKISISTPSSTTSASTKENISTKFTPNASTTTEERQIQDNQLHESRAAIIHETDSQSSSQEIKTNIKLGITNHLQVVSNH